MKNNFTHLVSGEKYQAPKHNSEKPMRPSKKTIEFLKMFARNYQVEDSLPEGLQGFMIG